jgi:3-hydroxyacyl-CoA dehydrogenase
VAEGKLLHLGVDGEYRPVRRAPGVLRLADIKRTGAPLARNPSASLWDLGDGVLCVELHAKMNALDPAILDLLGQALERVQDGPYRALVVHTEGTDFSVGANLGVAMFAVNIAAWDEVEKMVRAGQRVHSAIRSAPFPVVGAPSGMALAGGCELLLHCAAVQAHAETYLGLVEVGVGLIPGWGGCTALLQRWSEHRGRPGGPMPPIIEAFETISTAAVSKSAEEARDLLFLRACDRITMNRDRLLADAKQRALELAEDYAPPAPIELRLPGATAKAALRLAVRGFRQLGKATEHDAVVADRLADVLSGGETDLTTPLGVDDLLRLEREAFMALLHEPRTLARIEHMLETGKPLRN